MKDLKSMSLEELWELFPIVIKEHKSDYAVWYEEEKRCLNDTLEEVTVCRINHIGSTSIKGLLAKPIVDILLELPSDYSLDFVEKLLEDNGWILMGKDSRMKTLDLNKGYTPHGFDRNVFHLHVKMLGDWDELYFRDYLKENPIVARQYETLKLRLKQQYEHNRDGYTQAKTDFIKEFTKKAREEFGSRYLP